MGGTVPAFVQPHGLYCPSLRRHFKRHCLLFGHASLHQSIQNVYVVAKQVIYKCCSS